MATHEEITLARDIDTIIIPHGSTTKMPKGTRVKVLQELGGSVTVRSAVWTKRLDPTAGLFDFGAGGAGVPSAPVVETIPLRFDIRVLIPSSLRVDNNLIENMVASADLQLRGTYERPVVVGRAEVDRDVLPRGAGGGRRERYRGKAGSNSGGVAPGLFLSRSIPRCFALAADLGDDTCAEQRRRP